jgi:hypothetical protein
MILWK